MHDTRRKHEKRMKKVFAKAWTYSPSVKDMHMAREKRIWRQIQYYSSIIRYYERLNNGQG